MIEEKRPVFLAVPNMLHHLTIKATANGITLLKDGRFKKRYTGSKTSCVDINGNFYSRAGDLQKLLKGSDPGIKKPPKRPSKGGKEVDLTTELPAQDNEKSLSTNEKKECSYRVNKVEVRQRIQAMINTRKGRNQLYFWTITFPKCVSDDLAYQAFNTWLTTLRQKRITPVSEKRLLREYIWVAERQDGKRLQDPSKATNTIHFHIAIPHQLDVKIANGVMRTILSTFAKKRLIDYSVYQAKRYNGVDIKKNKYNRKVVNFAEKKGSKALANYLTKYVTKNDSGFPHLAWHNSRGFSALFTGVTMTVKEFYKAGFMLYLHRRAVISNDFFSFYPWTKDPPDSIIEHLFEVNSFLQDQLN